MTVGIYFAGHRYHLRRVAYRFGHHFVRFLAKFFRKQGYEVEETRVSGDQGADLLLYKDERRIAVQAKRWERTVGNEAVREVHVGRTFYNTYEA